MRRALVVYACPLAVVASALSLRAPRGAPCVRSPAEAVASAAPAAEEVAVVAAAAAAAVAPDAKEAERILLTADGVVYDVTDFDHPGGRELLVAHAGEDVTHLVASNHRRPDVALRAAPRRSGAGGSYFERGHALYDALKREVHAAVGEAAPAPRRGVGASAFWPYAARGACVAACRLGVAPAAAAALYGVLLARTVWTVTHEYVHAPARWPRAARAVHAVDFANVGDVWLAEHHRHHADTNREGDPDRRWFAPFVPAFDAIAADRRRGGPKTLAAAAACYPLLPLFMVFRVAAFLLAGGGGAAAATPRDRFARRALVVGAALAAPRFALDAYLLRPFYPLTFLFATSYLALTFVATHTADERNYALNARPPETQDQWLADQVAATNDVHARSKAYAWLTGGINCHTAHHLFPNLPGARLHAASAVVEDFAERHGLAYRNFGAAGLWSSHARFLLGRKPAADAEVPRRCPATRALHRGGDR